MNETIATQANSMIQASNETSLMAIAATAILTAAATFAGSFFLKRMERNQDNRVLKQYFISKAIVSLEGLNVLLTNLSNDPIRYGYFSLQTILKIKPILSRLQSASEEKLFLFRDPQFNSNVINTIDEITAVIEEIEAVELDPVNKYKEYSNVLKESQAEYRALKLKLLEMGFAIDDKDLKPKSITNSSASADQENMLTEISSLIGILDNKISTSQKNLDENNTKAKEQRAFFAAKLANMQLKTKDLIEKLRNLKIN